MPESGFVPTMGALHDGHISLIMESRRLCSLTFASIFVNPTQFNDPSDYEKYPVTIDNDIRQLEQAGCDVLFLPGVNEIYPEGTETGISYDLGNLERLLEGKFRPGHFQGVSRVVHRLLDIVRPAHLFMGQKDFQQCMVVQRLIALEKLPVTLHTCRTLREPDGLAMSSRNLRLSTEARSKATGIFREMKLIEQQLETRNLRQLENEACNNLLDSGFSSVDYISIARPETLEPLKSWQPGEPAVILAAAFIGGVRLIDNLPVNYPG